MGRNLQGLQKQKFQDVSRRFKTTKIEKAEPCSGTRIAIAPSPNRAVSTGCLFSGLKTISGRQFMKGFVPAELTKLTSLSWPNSETSLSQGIATRPMRKGNPFSPPTHSTLCSDQTYSSKTKC